MLSAASLMFLSGCNSDKSAASCDNQVIKRIDQHPYPRSVSLKLVAVPKEITPETNWLVFQHWRMPIADFKKLKSKNPDTIFLAYYNPTFYYKFYPEQTSAPVLNGAPNPEYIKGHNYVNDILPHKEWFVYRKGGYIPYEKVDQRWPKELWDDNALSSYYYPPDKSGKWFTERNMNMTNPEWREFAADLLAKNIRARGFDGLYLDDMTTMYKVGPDQQKIWTKHILPKVPSIGQKWIDENLDAYYDYTGKKISGKEWSDALLAFTKLVKSKLSDKLILYNGHHRITSADDEEALFLACDGWLSENFLAPHELEAYSWNGYINLVENITSHGRVVLAIPTPSLVKDSEKNKSFYFTSCLLTDAVYWDEISSKSPAWYNKIKLGFPKGKRYELDKYNGVWVREYDKGVVIVNSNKYPVNIKVPWKGDFVFRTLENSYDNKDGYLPLEDSSGEIIITEE